jgi:hypothetical protein
MKTSFRRLVTVTVLTGSALVPCQAAVRNHQTGSATNSDSSQIRSFTRLLSGNGWETTIVLMDMGSSPVSFRQSFLDNDGLPAPFNVNLQTTNMNLTTSALQGVIAPYGTATFTLVDDGSALHEAWSLLTFDGAQNQLAGYAVVRHRASDGNLRFEATLPAGNLMDSSARMPFDNTQGFQTQLTVVNPASNLAAQVQLTYFNAAGQAILLDSLTLNPGQQTTLTLPNTYPDLADQTGTIAVLANINCLSVSGLRVNPATGAVTAVPVMDFTPSVTLQ